MKILIIDDEENYTALLKLNLEFRLGHEVEMVNRSDEAVEAALRFRPDVILLDVVMPGMDGGDVLHPIRNASSAPAHPSHLRHRPRGPGEGTH